MTPTSASRARKLHDLLGRGLGRVAEATGSGPIQRFQPDDAARVDIVERSWLVPPRMAAWTIGHTIIGRGEVSGRLLVHEMVHVRQLEADPWFGPRYLIESVRRRSYRANRYEVEARTIAERTPPAPS